MDHNRNGRTTTSDSSTTMTSGNNKRLPLSPEPIFQMTTAYWISKTLMTAVELDLFTRLGDNASKLTLEELQKLLQMEKRPADTFATALVSLGLLKVENGDDGIQRSGRGEEHGRKNKDIRLYSNSELADTFLVKGKEGYMGDIITMFDKRLYKAWDKLIDSLRQNKPIPLNEGGYAESLFHQAADPNESSNGTAIQQIQGFTHAMYGISIGPAMALGKSFDFSNHRRMMDIGGGSGVYAIQIAKEHPNMSAVVIDLAPVCQVANQYIQEFGLEDRIHTKSLNIFEEDLPDGCDIAFLSFIIHDYSEQKNKALFEKIYESLPNNSDDGVIIISEWLLNDEKTGPLSSSLMGLNMMIETNGGKSYSFADISKMLEDTGFTNIEKRHLVGPAEIVIGCKSR